MSRTLGAGRRSWSAVPMDDVRLARELLTSGLTKFEISNELRRGTLQRVRRGAYASRDETDRAVAHRKLLDATLALTHPGAVVSHGSAAVLHGLPVPAAALERVHLTRDREGGGQRRRWVQVHGHRLGPEDVWQRRRAGDDEPRPDRGGPGLRQRLPDAVAVGDAALRQGTEVGDLLAVLARVGPRRGIATARRAIELLDARSESYGESVSRALLVGRRPRPHPAGAGRTTAVALSWVVSTSPGLRSASSESSTGGSSTAATWRRSRTRPTCSGTRSCGRTGCVSSAGSWSGGPGPTCSTPTSGWPGSYGRSGGAGSNPPGRVLGHVRSLPVSLRAHERAQTSRYRADANGGQGVGG